MNISLEIPCHNCITFPMCNIRVKHARKISNLQFECCIVREFLDSAWDSHLISPEWKASINELRLLYGLSPCF